MNKPAEKVQQDIEIADPCIVPKEWNIWQRINWVRSQEHYVKKDARVDGKYDAVTHDAVTATVHDLVVKAGIIIFPNLKTSAVIDTGTKTKNGTPIIRYEATYIVVFASTGDSGQAVESIIESHANDTGDKAPGKCCSYAVKTATLKMFFMETGVNDEGRIDAKIAETKGQEPVAEKQVEELESVITSGGLDRDAVVAWVKKSMKVESLSDLNQSGFAEVKRVIESKVKKNENS